MLSLFSFYFAILPYCKKWLFHQHDFLQHYWINKLIHLTRNSRRKITFNVRVSFLFCFWCSNDLKYAALNSWFSLHKRTNNDNQRQQKKNHSNKKKKMTMHTRQLDYSINQRKCQRWYRLLACCHHSWHLWRSMSRRQSHVTEWQISHKNRTQSVVARQVIKALIAWYIKAFLHYRKLYKLSFWIRGNMIHVIEWRHKRLIFFAIPHCFTNLSCLHHLFFYLLSFQIYLCQKINKKLQISKYIYMYNNIMNWRFHQLLKCSISKLE